MQTSGTFPELSDATRKRVAMPKFLEDALKKRYGAKSTIPYKVMNKIGAMKGNQITAKGKAMEAKHEAGSAFGAKAAPRRVRVPPSMATRRAMSHGR